MFCTNSPRRFPVKPPEKNLHILKISGASLECWLRVQMVESTLFTISNPKCSLSSKRLLFPSHETLVGEKVQVSLLHGLWWPCCPFLKTYLLTLNKENQLNVGRYTIHGSYGSSRVRQLVTAKTTCLPCQLKMSESDAVPRPSGKPTTGETEPEWKSWRFFVTLQGINISPEKWWLEDVFPIEIVPFWGTC